MATQPFHERLKTEAIVRKLWRWISVGVGATTLAAGLAVAATPSGAATHPAIHITRSQRGITPDSCTGRRNYLGAKVTFTSCSGGIQRSGCSTGNNGAISGPLYAANGCQTQLWLWLTHTTSGTPVLCVDKMSSTNSLKKYYEEFEVSTRTGKCGT
jgi:hypothetical protein